VARALHSVISEIVEVTPDPLDLATAALKALSHAARVRILAMLRQGGLCVCQVASVLDAPLSTASEHLGELRRAGLLDERRQGRWVTYSLIVRGELQDLLGPVWRLVAEDPLVLRDARRVRKLRRLPVAGRPGGRCAAPKGLPGPSRAR
jgi:DNA-binding transcriptional ArsR family regulator